MDALAADLREAASELLEIPGSRASAGPSSSSSSPSISGIPKRTHELSSFYPSRSPTASASTIARPSSSTTTTQPNADQPLPRLIRIDSNDNIIDDAKPRPPPSQTIVSGQEHVVDLTTTESNAEESATGGTAFGHSPSHHERFESLHSRAPPIRMSSPMPQRRRTRPSLSPPPADGKTGRNERDTSDTTSESSRFPPEKDKAKSNVRDQGMWLNERGERIVDGKVIGKMTLAKDWLTHTDVPRDGSSHDSTLSSGGDQGAFDHLQHGSSVRLHKPAFFIQSFPAPRQSITNGASPPTSLMTLDARSDDPEDHFSDAMQTEEGQIASPEGQPSETVDSLATSAPETDSATEEVESSTTLPLDTPVMLNHTIAIPPDPPEYRSGPEEEVEEEVVASNDPDTAAADSRSMHSSNDCTSTHSRSRSDSASSLFSLPASSIGTSSSRTSHRARMSRRLSSTSAHSRHSRVSSTSSSLYHPDPAADDDEPFTRSVLIRGWSEVGRRSTRGYVSYEVYLTTLSGLPIHVHRRYSSFLSLRSALLLEVPIHARGLKELPKKDPWRKYEAAYLEARRKALQEWLQGIYLDRRWGGTRAAREWLVGVAEEA